METEVFRGGLADLIASARGRPAAFMCAEADWHRCHRRMIADATVAGGGEVIHLLNEDRREAHVLDRRARVEGRVAVYDRGTQPSLL
jgi:uncharacterized protein (DUF488 family)